VTRRELPDEDERREAAKRWRALPPPVPAESLVELQAVEDARDPDAGRDPERDWLLRNA
jgi:hypothetical protein